nr:hypothetical protein BaRGS_031253 [Batillaria attramentaria]
MAEAKKSIELVEKEQQVVKDKKAAVQAVVRNRHATMQAAIDKYRDDALTSLDTATDDMLSVLQVDLFIGQQNLKKLTMLEQRLQQGPDSGAGCELVTVAREMRCGRGSEETVQKLQTKQIPIVCFPVLHTSATRDTTLPLIRDYMGRVAKIERGKSSLEAIVVEQFRCREDPDIDVCHVCPMTDGTRPPPYSAAVPTLTDGRHRHSPPLASFQPSDVCFYILDDHEVLLVADELNDAIHVVDVQKRSPSSFKRLRKCQYDLSFARYLAPGCPLLVQPTALNIDTRGRLWVACRGGRILTCEPII